MAFTPTPAGSMPTPDQVLAQLAPESGEGAVGYITPDDIAFAWQVFLSRLAHHDDALTALQTAEQALTGRVSALESGAGSSGTTAPPFAQTVAQEASLPAVASAGTLLLALDTGQWFLSDGSSWDRLGVNPVVLSGDVTANVNRTNDLFSILQSLLGGQTIAPFSPTGAYTPGSVVQSGGKLWQAVQPSTGVTPTAQTPEWRPLDLVALADQVRQALAAQGASGAMPPPSDPADDGKVLTARHGAGVWEAAAPSGATSLDGLSDVTAPADTVAGKVLGTTATGAWGPVDPPQAPILPADLVHLTDLLGMAPTPYDAAATYAEGDIIVYNGSWWVAKSATTAGQDPTANPGKWLVLDLEALALKAAHAQQAAPPDPADPADDGKVLTARAGVGVWEKPSAGGTATWTFTAPAPTTKSGSSLRIAAGAVHLRHVDGTTVTDPVTLGDVNDLVISVHTIDGTDMTAWLVNLQPGSVVYVDHTTHTQPHPEALAFRVVGQPYNTRGMATPDAVGLPVAFVPPVNPLGEPTFGQGGPTTPLPLVNGDVVTLVLDAHEPTLEFPAAGLFLRAAAAPTAASPGRVFFAKADDSAATKPSEAAKVVFAPTTMEVYDLNGDAFHAALSAARVGDLLVLAHPGASAGQSARYRITTLPAPGSATYSTVGVTFLDAQSGWTSLPADSWPNGDLIFVGIVPQAGQPIWTGTQAEYDAIAVKDPHRLYVVTG